MKTKSIMSFAIALGMTILASTTAVEAVGVGKACGEFVGVQCDKGMFCQHKTGACFFADFSGTCVMGRHAFATRFSGRYAAAMAAGAYGNSDCEREAAMVSKSHNGKCT